MWDALSQFLPNTTQTGAKTSNDNLTKKRSCSVKQPFTATDQLWKGPDLSVQSHQVTDHAATKIDPNALPLQKINQAFSDTHVDRRSSPPGSFRTYGVSRCKSRSEATISANGDSVNGVFIQGEFTTAEQTIIQLQNFKGKLNEIYLNYPNNELMALIAEKFPDIQSLHIQDRMVNLLDLFDDQALESIGKLQYLTNFEFRFTWAIDITPEGFKKLLSQQHLKKNLTALSVSYSSLDDNSLAVIGEYEQLNSLELDGAASLRGWTKMAQSEKLQGTLTSFCIGQAAKIDTFPSSDSLFEALTKYKKLNFLSFWALPDTINLKWVQKMIEANVKLEGLSLFEVPIDDATAHTIEKMKNLTLLEISDCSQCSEDGILALLTQKDSLGEVSLNNLTHLTDAHLAEIANLHNVRVLKLGLKSGCFVNSLSYLCDNMIGLEKLELTNFKDISPQQWCEVAKLKKLNTFKVVNAPWFNNDPIRALSAKENGLLTNLQLSGVSLSENSPSCLADLPSLEHLYLGKLQSFTENSYRDLFKSSSFEKQLKTLCLYEADFPSKTTSQWVGQLSALRALILKNCNIDYDDFIHQVAKDREWQFSSGLIFSEADYSDYLESVCSNIFNQAIENEEFYPKKKEVANGL